MSLRKLFKVESTRLVAMPTAKVAMVNKSSSREILEIRARIEVVMEKGSFMVFRV